MFASLENEGHALPPGVVNPEGSRGVCWADGVVRHGVVIEITGLSICRHILAEERVAALNGRNRTEHLDLQRGKDMRTRMRAAELALHSPSHRECPRPRTKLGAPL